VEQQGEGSSSGRALVVFESMYGNTRRIAEAIAEGLREAGIEAQARAVHAAEAAEVEGADLLVVGGPTHMHGMTTSMSRKAAIQAAEEEDVELEEGARKEPGLRSWLAAQHGERTPAAAFDTRIDRSPALTGAASRGIAKRLRRRGFDLVVGPQSFFVEDSEGPLAEGELERARDWSAGLAEHARSHHATVA
jgi:hypothetical protein